MFINTSHSVCIRKFTLYMYRIFFDMEINKHTAIFVDSIFTTQDFTLLKNDTNMISVFFYIL